jgi:hypothetical protein
MVYQSLPIDMAQDRGNAGSCEQGNDPSCSIKCEYFRGWGAVSFSAILLRGCLFAVSPHSFRQMSDKYSSRPERGEPGGCAV